MAKGGLWRLRAWLADSHSGITGWGLIAAAAVLLAVAGLWFFVSTEQDSAYAGPRGGGTIGRASPGAETGFPVALFVGDSYTAGTGASEDAKRWTTLVAADMGWDEANYGRGGTGYVATAGPEGCGREYCAEYRGTLAEASTDDLEFNVVVIAGGQNDTGAWSDDKDAVLQAVADTYETARQAFPDARIVAVGPSWLGEAMPWQEEFDAAVRKAARSIDAEYVSLLAAEAVVDPAVEAGDGAHVNDAGHAAIAAAVVAGLG